MRHSSFVIRTSSFQGTLVPQAAQYFPAAASGFPQAVQNFGRLTGGTEPAGPVAAGTAGLAAPVPGRTATSLWATSIVRPTTSSSPPVARSRVVQVRTLGVSR